MDLDSTSTQPISIADLQNLLGELRMLARRLLATESRADSFTPTLLAMTALRRAKLKDQDWEDVRWENRAHFFAALSMAMRNALIDHARRRKAKGRQAVIYFPPDESFFNNLATEAEETPDRVILLEEALARMEAQDKRLAEVIHQFYYAGYSISDMARFASVSEKTVDRELKKARILLRKMLGELSRDLSHEPSG
jgi:RNA polymerase sigma factor (TIGR02999 family)